MTLKHKTVEAQKGKSIFRSIFVPLFLIMMLQAVIFYFAAVYGGIEESLNQNAADILSERLYNRKNEIETQFNNNWSDLSLCRTRLDELYARYRREHGAYPFAQEAKPQISFLNDSVTLLIETLRHNEVNGIFLILNDQPELQSGELDAVDQKYGLCIRDMDQDSNYTGTEDLLLERAPSAIVDLVGCSLDSWWESKYTFATKESGDYYYKPLEAAWSNKGAASDDLAYCSGVHQLSRSDPAVISYSMPLLTEDGYPYAVLGVELSVRYLTSLLPSRELNEADKSCYVLALRNAGSTDCTPITGTGALYSRCFDADAPISCADTADMGGFWLTGRRDTKLYGSLAQMRIYNNNNPFEDRELTLLAIVESATLFAYIERVKVTLFMVALICLVLGLVSITYVSRRFASPITALAKRVRGMRSKTGFELGRLGITEIDLLVESIEELNQNVSKNSARAEFFSRMSHDMRTPMNAIISFSSPELLDGATETVKNDYLEKIHASGQFLLTLINEVLDMTKIESNKIELHMEKAQAFSLCDTVIPIIEKLAQKKNVTFVQEIDISPDVYVIVDRQHLNQIVMNLLSNAVKFTPKGGSVRLTAQAAQDAADPERLMYRVTVKDTGIGMSEAFIHKLYTPFEQESARQEGTGLGLTIAKKLVDLMDGSIQCESRQNVGTTFTVSLSLLKSDKPDSVASAEAISSGDAADAVLYGKRLLIFEDNAVNTMIICKLLQKRGIETVNAMDGKEGTELFAASAPGAYDAIMMDIRMPVMDGLEATRRIRAMDRPDAATIPIIAMTANAFEQDEHASSDAGMNAHLAKPIEPNKLFETLVRYLG